jgi:hypothetical protein
LHTSSGRKQPRDLPYTLYTDFICFTTPPYVVTPVIEAESVLTNSSSLTHTQPSTGFALHRARNTYARHCCVGADILRARTRCEGISGVRPALCASSARVYQSRPLPLRDAAKLGSHPFICQPLAPLLLKLSFSRLLVKELASAEFLDLLGQCRLEYFPF